MNKHKYSDNKFKKLRKRWRLERLDDYHFYAGTNWDIPVKKISLKEFEKKYGFCYI